MIVEFEHFQLVKNGKTFMDLADLIRKYGYYIYYLEYEYPSDHVCVHQDMLGEFNEKFRDMITDHHELNNINYNITFGIDKKIKI